MAAQPMTPRQQRRFADTYETSIRPHVPDYVDAGFRNDRQRARYARGLTGRGRFGRAVGRLGVIRSMSESYSQPEDQLREYSLGELGRLERGESGVNLRHESSPLVDRMRRAGDDYASVVLGDSPMLASLSKYTRERLGTGLTPAESAAIRGQNVEAVEAAAGEQRRQMGNQFAGSGLDARAQAAAMGRLSNETMQGRAGVERFVTEKELERKRDFESLGANVSGMELDRLAHAEGLGERAREYDVETEERRRGMIEDRLMKLADLANARREYDFGFLQSRREARANRELMRKLRRDAEPSGLEKTGAILGGVYQGLFGGGMTGMGS
jgi:hypothetical protein